MLNEFLLAAYKDTQTKLANRQLVDKLKAFDLDDLVALANGEPTAKLAYCDGPCDGPQSWLDKYKGSPLFEKAVALEKALLEADAAADAKRTEERESDRTMDDQRDALRMQKRMLDLDLALEQEGGAAAAASPEPAVPATPAPAAVEQAAAQPAVEVKAAAVGAFIPEARSTRDTVHPEARQGNGQLGDYSVDPSETVTEGLQVNKTAAAKVATADAAGRLFAKTATVAGFADEAGRMALNNAPALGAVGGYMQGRRAGEMGLIGGLGGSMGATMGAAGGGLLGDAVGRGATKLLAHTPVSPAITSNIVPVLRAAGILGGGALGFSAGTSAQSQHIEKNKQRETSKKQGVKQAEVSANTATLLHALLNPLPGSLPGAVGARFLTNPHDPDAQSTARRYGALGGGALGALQGIQSGAQGGHPMVGMAAGGLLGALGGGLAAGHVAGKVVREHEATHTKHKKKTAAEDPKAFYESVIQRYPQLAGKKKQAGIAGSLLQGVKTLGTGAKNLATTAHAAGGMPQVAKSFGNVAKNFAQKNPLAATGIAAGAAGLGGMALGRATAPNR